MEHNSHQEKNVEFDETIGKVLKKELNRDQKFIGTGRNFIITQRSKFFCFVTAKGTIYVA